MANLRKTLIQEINKELNFKRRRREIKFTRTAGGLNDNGRFDMDALIGYEKDVSMIEADFHGTEWITEQKYRVIAEKDGTLVSLTKIED